MSAIRDLRIIVKNYIDANDKMNQYLGIANECLLNVITQKDYVDNYYNYRKKINLEKKAIQKKIKNDSLLKKINYELYKKNISTSSFEKNKFLDLIYEKIDLQLFEINEENLKKMRELEYDVQVDLIQNLYSFSIDYYRLQDFIYLNEKEGNKLNVSNELYKLIEEIKNAIRGSKFLLINDLIKQIKNIIELSKNNSNNFKYNASLLNEINDVVYEMENEIGNSVGELINIKCTTKENNYQRILELENETFKICSDLANLEYVESSNEIREIKRSIFGMIANEEALIEDKISFIEKRIGFLRDKYLKYCSIIGNAIEYKRKYDEKYNILLKYIERLNLECYKYSFDYKNPEKSIVEIDKQLHLLKPMVEEKDCIESIRRLIWDTMFEQSKDLISTKKIGKNKDLIQDIFYNGDGTVTIITYFPNGRITERVAGVKLAGINEDKLLIVDGMKRECDIHKQTLNKYRNSGINVEVYEIIEPNIENAIEIELDSSVSIDVLEKIRRVKLGQDTFDEKKVRYVK